jgi:hypothetical protein
MMLPAARMRVGRGNGTGAASARGIISMWSSLNTRQRVFATSTYARTLTPILRRSLVNRPVAALFFS